MCVNLVKIVKMRRDFRFITNTVERARNKYRIGTYAEVKRTRGSSRSQPTSGLVGRICPILD